MIRCRPIFLRVFSDMVQRSFIHEDFTAWSLISCVETLTALVPVVAQMITGLRWAANARTSPIRPEFMATAVVSDR